MCWRWCGIACCLDTSRAAISCRLFMSRCPGRRLEASSVLAESPPSFAGPKKPDVRAAALAGCLTVVASIVVQMQPSHLNHLSRSGHWAAGRWLAEHAEATELVLDTRGWAKFVSGHPGYDYWHVHQALTDSHLAYIVVGVDELQARSTRASTLQSLLSYSATHSLDFPTYPGDPTPAVKLYRFHRPNTWEGLVP